jgi:hypothetical protein
MPVSMLVLVAPGGAVEALLGKGSSGEFCVGEPVLKLTVFL